MEFAELPGSSPCLNPKQHSEECICFNHCPADLNSRLQSQAHRELTHVLLPRVFSQSPNLQRSSWAATQIHHWCSEPGMHHLCCNVQHQSKMTFFNARRKNGEVLAVEIVREVLRFQIKDLKKHQDWSSLCIYGTKRIWSGWHSGHRFLQ